MFLYYFDLALRSFRSARGLTALMVLTIAMGIGASMTTLTTFRALSGDPLPARSANVLRVQLDSGRKETFVPGAEPDTQLERYDAEALLRDKRAFRQAAMVGGSVTVEPAADAPGALKPFVSSARYASADFFVDGVRRYGSNVVRDQVAQGDAAAVQHVHNRRVDSHGGSGERHGPNRQATTALPAASAVA